MPTTLLLIHHSHTDIGYTDPQAVVERWHVAYLRRALDLVRTVPGFRWQCECMQPVARFLDVAGPAEAVAFADAVRDGRIGLSASWLNLNELAGQLLLDTLGRRARDLADRHRMPLRSAMTADINGSSWGFATALLDAGVGNLFTCVHTHHGRYPLDRPQTGFWWEAPDGRRVLVWSGEHYHFGNELGLAPDAVSSYLTKDDCDADLVFHDHWTVAERRIPRYLDRLRADGCTLTTVPVMISGLRTDNGPPSGAIAETAARWNREHGDVCRVEMGTLDTFFERLRAGGADALPCHRGDWPDWWSDGLASEPQATRLFRQAHRDWTWLRAFHARHPELPAPDLAALEDQLALYAEHTFGHSDSLTAPWHALVQSIGARKRAYAAVAADVAARELDAAFAALGGGPPARHRPLRFRVCNPLDVEVAGVVPLIVEHYEYRERCLDRPVTVRDAAAGIAEPWQRRPVPRGMAFEVGLTLAPGEERELELAAGDGPPTPDPEPQAWAQAGEMIAGPLHLSWSSGSGVTALRAGDDSLLDAGASHAPLAPLLERTPVGGDEAGDQARTRGAMVRNRKGPEEIREQAGCVGGRVVVDGPVSVRHVLRFEGAGCDHAELELTAHRRAPILEMAIRLRHRGTWDPENLYVPLPFAWPDADELVVCKPGGPLRPWRDQIPGTLTDWTCLQDGFAWIGHRGGLAVAPLDAPLVWLGPLDSGPRRLAGDPELPGRPDRLYSWLATNYWETNFNADLGGWLECRYRLTWGPDIADPDTARARLAALSADPRTIRQGA